MFEVEIGEGRKLVVDFEGRLSNREEQIQTYRFVGKSKGAIAKILGIKPDTVNKQVCSAHKKLEVDGFDNPLAMLQSKAFLNNWARFAVLTLVVGISLFTPRPSQFGRYLNSRIVRTEIV